MTATTAAYRAFRDVFARPDAVPGQVDERLEVYDVLFDYYTNRAFEDANKYARYLSGYRLYRHTRLIYNPVRRLTDFYAAQVYPGVLWSGQNQRAEFPEAIPLEDIDDRLAEAVKQLWQWTNFQAAKNQYVRTGAMTGNVLVCVVDDLERQKILFDFIWPGLIKDIRLDRSGNVVYYKLEYTALDEDGQSFQFTKEVDRVSVRTYYNQEPRGFNGQEAIYANPYGFVPAIWVKHRDTGTDYGAPAIGALPKIDEVNSLASHIHDQIHKLIESPQLISTTGEVGQALKAPDPQTNEIERQQARLLLKTDVGASVHSLTGNLDLEAALPYLTGLMSEIEADHPELTFYQKLREMTQVTGPGAQRLLGDVQGAVWEAAANYDQGLVKLFQMSVAIGGWRVAQGDWDSTRQADKFKGFDLESYEQGDLDMTIAPRPLVPMSDAEIAEQDGVVIDNAMKFRGLIDLEDILIEADFDEERRAEILRRAPKPLPPIDPNAPNNPNNPAAARPAGQPNP